MNDTVRGILLITFAMAAFAVEDAIIKYLSADLPAGQILFLIGIGGTSAFYLFARSQGDRFRLSELRHPAVMARNVSELVGTASLVTALSLVPLSLLSALIQVNPLIVTLGAALLLKESVGIRRWTAIFVGFAAVLIMLRPWNADFDIAILFGLLGVLGLSARDIATRRVPREISTNVLATLGFAATLPAGLILLAFSDGWKTVTLEQSWILLGGVFIGIIAYFCIVQAMRIGQVSAITPFRYTRLPFGFAMGLLFFGETMDFWTIFGAAVIVVAGLYSLWREAKLASQ